MTFQEWNPKATGRVGVQRHGQEAQTWMRAIVFFPTVQQPQGDPGVLFNILSLDTNVLNTASKRRMLGTHLQHWKGGTQLPPFTLQAKKG